MFKIFDSLVSINIFSIKRVISIILIILFLCVGIISAIFYNSYKEQKDLDILNREYYGKSMQTFSVIDKEKSPINLSLISKYLPKGSNCAVYYNDENHFRQIFFQGKYNTPPLISGRFFTPSDFKSNNRYAVVGLNCVDDCKTIVNKKYIKYQGCDYEVIGIVGSRKTSMLNFTVFIASNENLMAENSVFVLDINDQNSSTTFSDFQNNLNNQGYISNTILAAATSYEVLNRDKIGLKLIVAAFICFTLSILIVSIQWINFCFSEIAVKRLLGFKLFGIFLNSLLKYLIYASIGIAIAQLILYFSNNLSLVTFLFSLVITLITSIIVFIPSAIKLSHITVAEALK